MLRHPIWQVVELDLDEASLLAFPKEDWLHRPLLYILQSDKKIYIGWTFYLQHDLLAKLTEWQGGKLYVFFHDCLNESALKNFESLLLQAFLAEGDYQMTNLVTARNRFVYHYYQDKYYGKEVFDQLLKLLKEQGLLSHPMQELRNRDAYKLSPFHDLSWDQLALKEQVLVKLNQSDQANKKVIFLKGEAGTGKSLLLSALFATLLEEGRDVALLVNHQEVLKTYQVLQARLNSLQGAVITSPQDFIQKKLQSKILLVDEGHLLWAKSEGDSHLQQLLASCSSLLCVFDPFQILHTESYKSLEEILSNLDDQIHVSQLELRDQIRMRSSRLVWNWVDGLVKDKLIKDIPIDQAGKNLFEFKVMRDLAELRNLIHYRDKQVGLSRMVATLDLSDQEGAAPFDNLPLSWAPKTSKSTWAEDPASRDQVGSIYNIQGFDLNYAGVILGPTFDYDADKDQLILTGGEGQDKASCDRVALNALNVLMKRGVKGLYVYAVNPALRQRLLDLQEEAILNRKEKSKK